MNRLNGFFINRLPNKFSSVLLAYTQVSLFYLTGSVATEAISDN